MQPEEVSRELAKILGSAPFTMDERDRINEAVAVENLASLDDLPNDIKQLLKRPLPDYTKPRPEKRGISLSTVERSIIKDSDKCKLCVANNDPRKVPIHPNCHCDVITDSVQTGTVDRSSKLLDILQVGDEFEIELAGDEPLPTAIQLNPETVAVFDPNDVRFSDLARWLEQMDTLLQGANQYVSIVVDEDTDEALAEVEEALAIIAEDPTELAEQLRNKKLWFAISQAVAF
jgi:hypothetical protein